MAQKNKEKNRRVASDQRKGIHVVKRGENLEKIAAKYKISVGHLKRMNGLKSSRIMAGEKLRTQANTYSSSKLIKYRVRKGDNLTEIAKKFQTSIGQIKRTNKLFGNRVLVGQTLKIRLAENID